MVGVELVPVKVLVPSVQLAAMSKLYPTRRMFGKTGALDQRWRHVV